jgi:uncharacterized protein (DUF924 family)
MPSILPMARFLIKSTCPNISMNQTLPTPQPILDFWFSPEVQPYWFARSDALDAEIAQKWRSTYEAARDGALDHWQEQADSALALVILLDQFPRNLFRGSPQAFATDSKALNVSRGAIERELDQQIPASQRNFFYLPFMHSEVLDDQKTCVRLFEKLGNAMGLDYAWQHLCIIERFGRFPHRNATLGRESTAEEIAFLQTPGSSF